MKLPKYLDILGKRWTVVVKPLRSLEGQCVHRLRQIQIAENLPPDEKQEVLLHEILHACLPEQTWGARTEETIVRRLSPRLLETLQGLGWAPRASKRR